MADSFKPDAPAADSFKADAEPPKSLGGFISNLVSSAGKFAGDVVSPVLHPGKTLEGVTGLIAGMGEKAGMAAPPGVDHTKSVDALVKHYSDRYGSWDGFTHALYTDPVGVAADIATLASGAGAAGKGVQLAADAANLPRVAAAAGTVAKAGDVVSAVTDPLRVATKAAGGVLNAADKLVPAAGDALRRSALKGGFTVNTPAADVSDALGTMKEGQIPMSSGGAKKIADALNDLRQEIEARTKAGAQQGLTIDPSRVQLRLDDLRRKFGMQVNPDSDLRDIDKVADNFSRNNPQTIPVDQAQAMKIGSNALNSDKYGKVSTAQVEAEKALTRGIKEELENQIPELGDLNARQAKLMNLDDILGKAVNKYTNNGSFFGSVKSSLNSGASRTLGVLSGGALAGGHATAGGAGVAADLMMAILSDPVVKSRLATTIDLVSRANPAKWGTAKMGTGLARVEQLATGLSRVQPEQGQ